MPRKPRLEYEGAVYHVMDRGDRLESIFWGDEDCALFLKTLGQACERTGWRVHSYVLMRNHYHLLLETPEPNLSSGMQWLQSTYTIRHNVKHQLKGHLFQGRYKAILVDDEDDSYFRTVSDYIHLNPVRAGLIGAEGRLSDFSWSSFPALCDVPKKRPAWLSAERVLEQGDTPAGRRHYRDALEHRAAEERRGKANEKEPFKGMRRGWCFGSEEFQEKLLARLKQRGVENPAFEKMHNEQEAKRIMDVGLMLWKLSREGLKRMPKGSMEKIAIAFVIRKRTMMSNNWIAKELHMGHPSRVCRYCSSAESNASTQRLVDELEMSIGKA